MNAMKGDMKPAGENYEKRKMGILSNEAVVTVRASFCRATFVL
jgi:hypothetical protein